MSDSESVDYLQPGFNPASLTAPRLRSILVTYNVHYASNAKKPELVELFNANVAPQASKILARRARAKRSSMGIIDVTGPASSSHGQSGDGFGDSYDQPQTSPKKKRAVRQSSQLPIDEEDRENEEEAVARRQQRRSSPRKRASRSASYQPADVQAAASDSDSGAAPPVGVAAAARPPSRRSRAKTPQVKLEPTEEEEHYHTTPAAARRQALRPSSADDDTTFTYDNPFQSGSSPLSGPSPSSSTRRRTAGNEPAFTATGAASSRKRLDGSRVVSSPALQAGSYESPAVRAAAQRRASPFAARAPSSPPEPEQQYEEEEEEEAYDDGYDPLEPGEEFTPEEQLELELSQEEEAVRQRNQSGKSSKAVSRRKSAGATTRRRGVASALATPLLVLMLTLLGIYGAWYRQEKLAVGFCGLGRPAVPLLSEQLDQLFDKVEWLPDWLRDVEVPSSMRVLIEPQCEPCPQHAFCYSDFSVRCENGYILKPHPLSLGGLVPLPPTCEPDGERARRVKAVADKAIEELRDRRAKWECGDLVDEDGQVPDDAAMDVPVLKEVISEKRSKKMSKEEFDDLWTAAIGDIESRDEVESEADANYAATDPGSVPNTRLSSTSLARLPLACAVRRSIRLGLARYRLPLSVLVLSVLAALYVRARFRAHRAALARVPALVDLVLERLAAQKELWLYDEGAADGSASPEDDEASPDQFLFLPQLRDDVLRTTHSLAARERIWKHVRAVVEQNSNVRTGQREGRNGEVGRAWEWIGPVGTASSIIGGGGNTSVDMSAVRRRRSGRASVMGGGGGSRAGSAAPRDSLPRETESVEEAPRREEGVAGGGENRSALHRRWQESRPIY